MVLTDLNGHYYILGMIKKKFTEKMCSIVFIVLRSLVNVHALKLPYICNSCNTNLLIKDGSDLFGISHFIFSMYGEWHVSFYESGVMNLAKNMKSIRL